jgi:2Fe-2S ferredoxin
LKKDISIKVLDRSGKFHVLKMPIDMNLNLMEAFKAYELPVEGTCGGIAMCASCQCYVNSPHKLTEKNVDEKAMLSEAFNVKSNSRLGCQIYLSADLDGLEIQLAPEE